MKYWTVSTRQPRNIVGYIHTNRGVEGLMANDRVLIRAIQSRLTSTTSTTRYKNNREKKSEASIGKFIIQALLVNEARITKREKKKGNYRKSPLPSIAHKQK